MTFVRKLVICSLIISQYAHLNIPSVLFHFCDMVCLNNEDLEMYVKIKLNSKRSFLLKRDKMKNIYECHEYGFLV